MRKIIVVDDDPDFIYSVKHGLETLDDSYEVFSADSGMKCLELLENNVIPEVILLDIMMEKMSGWETFDKIRENPSWKNIPIIFVTALTDKKTRAIGKSIAEDYIEKPFRISELKERIENLTREHQEEFIKEVQKRLEAHSQ